MWVNKQANTTERAERLFVCLLVCLLASLQSCLFAKRSQISDWTLDLAGMRLCQKPFWDMPHCSAGRACPDRATAPDSGSRPRSFRSGLVPVAALCSIVFYFWRVVPPNNTAIQQCNNATTQYNNTAQLNEASNLASFQLPLSSVRTSHSYNFALLTILQYHSTKSFHTTTHPTLCWQFVIICYYLLLLAMYERWVTVRGASTHKYIWHSARGSS